MMARQRLAIPLTVCALIGLATALFLVQDSQRAAIRGLQDQLSELSGRQDLIASKLDAKAPTGGVPAAGPAASEDETASEGATRVFARIVLARPQPYGWEITIRPAQYFSGEAAFSLATARGELPRADGSYIVDTSTKTVDVRLLRATPVRLNSWTSTMTGRPGPGTAAELASVIMGGGSQHAVWKDGWYWLSIRERVVMKVEQQAVR
jgi:hypothetical protein